MKTQIPGGHIGGAAAEKGQKRQSWIGALMQQGRQHGLNRSITGIDGDQIDFPTGEIFEGGDNFGGRGHHSMGQTVALDIAADVREFTLVAAACRIADNPHPPVAIRGRRL